MTETKQFRLRLWCHHLIPALRRKMKSTVTPHGLVSPPGTKPTTANVVDFALVVADTVMQDDRMVIDSKKFLASLNGHLNEQFNALAALRPDERQAMLEMLVVSNSVLGSFSRSAPLQAAKPISNSRN